MVHSLLVHIHKHSASGPWSSDLQLKCNIPQAGCASVLRVQESGNACSLVDSKEGATLSLFTPVAQMTFTF